jgi:hypothetical protein
MKEQLLLLLLLPTQMGELTILRKILTQLQPGIWLKRKTRLLSMEKNITSALEIITVTTKSTMECMQTINQVTMMRGARTCMTVVQLVVPATNCWTRPQLPLQKHLLESLPSTTNFEMHFSLKPDSQLKQLVASGRMLRETSRSELQVEYHKDTSIILLPFITPDSNDLTFTSHIYFIFKTFTTMLNIADYTFRYFKKDFPTEFLCWMGYIFVPIITATLLSCSSFIHEILSVPVYFWNLLWHPNGRSIIDMLQNLEGNGQFVSYNKQNHHYRLREWARPIPRWVWRQIPRRLRFHQSTLNPKDKSIIWGYDSRLCMSFFYQTSR